MDSIRAINDLTTDRIVVGQDLLIPTNMYTVQPGDSLYTISQMSFVSIEKIRLFNGLQGDALTIGMRLYLPPRTKYSVENFSYLTPFTAERNAALIRGFAPIHTFLGIFEYHVLEGGSLSTLDDQQAIRIARENRIAPLAVITNLTSSGFDPELTRRILGSNQIRNQVINGISQLVKSKNYAGVNIDFEQVPPELRDQYTSFLHSLKSRLKPEGYFTSVAVPPKTSDNIPWLKGYDYGGIGASVDFVFVMAYDFHEASSQPGPVAPIQEVRKTIEFALQHMNRNKVILGMPRYGYDWTMDNGNAVSGRAVSVAAAVENAMIHQVPISFSTEYQQPFYQYWDSNGIRHIVWYEDSRARAEKLELVVEYRLKGAGAWQLGLQFAQSAVLVEEFFNTKKVL